ncbi:MAG: NifU family protein [Bacteroidia bacterium]|nr:NifU family protein [Bacteroidia bacterium]
MLIYTEITPNPNSLKFVLPPEYPAIERGSWEITSPEESDSPLIQALWGVTGVRSLFITRAFISVTKKEEATWHELIPAIKEVLRTYLPAGPLQNPQKPELPEEGDTEREIQKIIEEYIRPGIAMDGGDVEFLGFSEGIVHLKLKGSCSGCPSSLFTLKAGIESLLTRLVPEVKAVVAE